MNCKALIAYCGLDCEKCDARTATLNDDHTLREKTAQFWTELNQVEITPEMINCVGCRVDGVKTPYCQNLCSIRQCAIDKGYTTCGDCLEALQCEMLGMITGSNLEAAANLNLKQIRIGQISA